MKLSSFSFLLTCYYEFRMDLFILNNEQYFFVAYKQTFIMEHIDIKPLTCQEVQLL